MKYILAFLLLVACKGKQTIEVSRDLDSGGFYTYELGSVFVYEYCDTMPSEDGKTLTVKCLRTRSDTYGGFTYTYNIPKPMTQVDSVLKSLAYLDTTLHYERLMKEMEIEYYKTREDKYGVARNRLAKKMNEYRKIGLSYTLKGAE